MGGRALEQPWVQRECVSVLWSGGCWGETCVWGMGNGECDCMWNFFFFSLRKEIFLYMCMCICIFFFSLVIVKRVFLFSLFMKRIF